MFPVWVYLLFVSNFLVSVDSRLGFPARYLSCGHLQLRSNFYVVVPFAIFWLRPAAVPRALIAAIILAPLLRATMCLTGDVREITARISFRSAGWTD